MAKPNVAAPRKAASPQMPAAAAIARKLRIVMVASECAPLAKTGGLGDVVAGLSLALSRLGHEVRIIMPLYLSVSRVRHHVVCGGSSIVHMGGPTEHAIGVCESSLNGEVPIWLVDYEAYFARPGIYSGPQGEYLDNAYRFAMFSRAAMQICKDRQFIPDVMHLHDWPSAPVAAFLKTWDKILSPLSPTASVLTIHNVGYQGVYDSSVFSYLGLGPAHWTADTFEDHGRINLLKGGIHYADAITTVSPTHAREMLEPAGGHGLAPYLSNRRAHFSGILNGVDYSVWDPAIDQSIPAPFSPEAMGGKAACKAALQQRFGLEPRSDWPLFGIISRFATQKGFNLLMEALPFAIGSMYFQLIVLGTGDPGTEQFFDWLTGAYAGRVGSHIGFSEELSHWIEAGSDMFLMPSLYEPCGLNQIYSMKYGTLPLVRATGGLEDTVQNYDEASVTGTGFKFSEPSSSALYYTMGWAVSTWFDRPAHIAAMRQQAMQQHFGWDDSAAAYVKVYQQAMLERGIAG